MQTVPTRGKVLREGERRLADEPAVDHDRLDPAVNLRDVRARSTVFELDVHPRAVTVGQVDPADGRVSLARDEHRRQRPFPVTDPAFRKSVHDALGRRGVDAEGGQNRHDGLLRDDLVAPGLVPELRRDAIRGRERDQIVVHVAILAAGGGP